MRGDEKQFRAACRELGQHLAERGHAIIVQGIADNTADLHIVNGYVEFARSHGRQGCIQVVRPHDKGAVYEDHARETPELFEFFSQTEGSWGGAHLASIREADAIITIAGGKGTYIAGLAGIAARKRVIPIASFGGASEALLRALLPSLDQHTAGEFRRLDGPWTTHLLVTASRLTGLDRTPRILIIHGRANDFLDLKDWLTTQGGIEDVVVMGQEFMSGASIPEKFERLASRVDAAIALATPDDRGAPAGSEVLANRARQNVWLEVGWFWGKLGRTRIMVLCTPDVEVPSDLQGLEVFMYVSRPRERSDDLRSFLTSIAPS